MCIYRCTKKIIKIKARFSGFKKRGKKNKEKINIFSSCKHNVTV